MDKKTFIKFGGSVITDKGGQETPDLSVIRRLSEELQSVLTAQPEQSILLGHGSGSFGHFYAARYNIHKGLQDSKDWIGFALTSRAALRLNRIVVDTLVDHGVPAMSFQPSVALQSNLGEIALWDTRNIAQALQRGLIPVVHGDVAFDTAQGSAIISTEKLLSYLANQEELRPQRIIIVGEDAVYTSDPHVDSYAERIPLVTSENIDHVLELTGESVATDVTGGMYTKIQTMWSLVQNTPGLEIHIIGAGPGLLQKSLLGEPMDEGTRIREK